MTREETIAVYREHSARLYNISHRIVGDSAEAEEIMQDTILKLATGSVRPVGKAATGAWLTRTCVRASIDALRRRRREKLFLDEYAATAFEMEDTDLDGSLMDSLNIGEVRAAIDSLPDPYRLVLNLTLIEGLDYGEISAYTNEREGTIRTQYSRARAKLVAILKGKNHE